MHYQDLINDVQQLVGKRLESIRPGAEIVLLDVDIDQDKLELRTTQGNQKTRPLSELRRIWQELCSHPAVHVDSVLAGSGSSRNQPETILANLAYVEWLELDRKKHLCFVGRPTHPLGTLKKMDSLQAVAVRQRLLAQMDEQTRLSAIIVTEDIQQVARTVEAATGQQVKSVQQGIYQYEQEGTTILLVAIHLPQPAVKPGTYAVVHGAPVFNEGSSVRIGTLILHQIIAGDTSIFVAAG